MFRLLRIACRYGCCTHSRHFAPWSGSWDVLARARPASEMLGCFSRLAVHCKLQCATKNLQKQTPHSTTREVYCKLWELGKKLPLPHTSLERGVGYMARNARINQAGRSETQACGLPCHNLRPKCHTECDLGLSPAAPCHAH